MRRLLSLCLLALPAFSADCDRACLKTVLDQYLNAVIQHNPSAVQLTPGYRQTENAVVKRPGQGIWQTAKGLGKVQRRYFDTVTQNAGYFGTLDETNGNAAVVTVRLKVTDKKVAEALNASSGRELELHYREQAKLDAALVLARRAITIGDQPPVLRAIILGEVRGEEAVDMLQSMNTGHDGSICTLHSNGPRDTLSRMETMVLMAGMELPVRVIREQIVQAIDVVVQQSRLRDGTRRVTAISEVLGMEGDIIQTQDIFKFDYHQQPTDGFLGELVPTGMVPRFETRLRDSGIELSRLMFVR